MMIRPNTTCLWWVDFGGDEVFLMAAALDEDLAVRVHDVAVAVADAGIAGDARLGGIEHDMRRAKFCISVDSSPMHIAATINPRTLGIHAWSDPRKVGPYSREVHVWKAGRIARRGEFNAAECLGDASVDDAAAQDIGAWGHAAMR